MPLAVITSDTFANFASSTLAGGASGAGTSLAPGDANLNLNTGDGALFPSAGPFYLVLGAGTTTPEVVKVTARTTDNCAIVRGQDGTTAQTWPVGTVIQHVLTAANLNNLWAALAAINSTQNFVLTTGRADPANDTAVGFKLSNTASTLDAVVGTSGLRFIKNSGSSYAVLASIDNNGNWVSNGGGTDILNGAWGVTLGSQTDGITIANTAASGARISSLRLATGSGGYSSYFAAQDANWYHAFGHGTNTPDWGFDGTNLKTTGSIGLSLAGAVKSLGGQASVGSFGVGVIVASVTDAVVNSTATTTVTTYTAPATGLYRVSVRVLINNGTSGNAIACNINFTDGFSGSATFASLFGTLATTTTYVALSGGSVANGPFICVPLVIEAQGSSSISIVYHDPTNTPNDRVTVIIERLS